MRHCLSVSLILAAALAGCGPRGIRHVAVDKVPLGKVVVYRNGVAFYERRAQIDGGKLTVRVPRERVDDFLKSLTVVDARTQRPLPVSFPRRQADDAPVIEMQLDVGGVPGARADVVMTYVTDALAWKPSYRLVLGDATDTAMLEGWAVVDNLSGEDWKDVVVGVGSSAAMSFRYDLWSVRTVEREQLAADEAFALAPPTAVSPYGGTGAAVATNQNVLTLDAEEIRGNATITDDYTKNIPVPGRTFEAALGAAGGSEGDAAGVSFSGSSSLEGQYVVDGLNTTGVTISDRAPAIDPTSTTAPPRIDPYTQVKLGDQKLAEVSSALIKQRQYVVVQGYAAQGERKADEVALERANLVRNQLIDAGVAPGRIRVESGGVAPRATVQILTDAAPPGEAASAARASADTSDAAPVGESLFSSGTPMTVANGTSAMVSVLRAKTTGREAYLYDAGGERGNARYAFKSVRLENPTDSTLEAGPITVYGQGRYVGEGLTDAVAPHASVVIPYALDRQIVVDRDGDAHDELSRLLTLQRGILTAEVQHIRTTALTITSRLRTPSTVYVRQPIEPGWTLLDPELPLERIGDALLVAVELGAGETRAIELREATPLTRRMVLGDTDTLDQLKIYVASARPSPELRAQLQAILTIHNDLFDTVDKIASLRERAAEYRDRQAELTGQLMALRKVKTAAALSSQLATKAAQMASRLQGTTLAIVEAQDKIMLLRVQFSDALAELHLADVTAVAAAR
ncbi:MAG: OmpA family protein [Myxococcales bacterium]|nr:OmpA family protein [Myxococcales bacterium]